MPYESTIVVSIPDQGTYQEIKEHIAACASIHDLAPDRWSICVTSQPNSSWGFIYYSHPSPSMLDQVNYSWQQRFENCAIERIHRITQAKFFETLAKNTKSGFIGIDMVDHLMELSNKGVTTNGMIEWMHEVRRDAIMMIGALQQAREAPYEPGKDSASYP